MKNKKNKSVCVLLITPPDLKIRDNHCKTCSLASKDSGVNRSVRIAAIFRTFTEKIRQRQRLLEWAA